MFSFSRLVLSIAILAVVPVCVQAASFCVGGASLPPQCLYEDVKDCRRAANSQDTSCLINPEATISTIGEARYCRIGSNQIAQCIYVDRASCNDDANRYDEICFDRDLIKDTRNPYRYDNRLQY